MTRLKTIELEKVTKSYNDFVAVDDLSISFFRNQVTTILGPNGAGKTTTINMMLGVIKPTSGNVKIFGKNPVLYHSRKRIGAMLQSSGHPGTLTPLELLKFWELYPNPKSSDEVIQKMNLQDFKNKKYELLSGGQKRRVDFAIALIGNPEILFLDEPSTGMDIWSRRLLWNAVKEFSEANKTVILCTHNLEEAEFLSNRIVLFNNGVCIADDTTENIKNKISLKTIKCKVHINENNLKVLKDNKIPISEDNYINMKVLNPEKIIKVLIDNSVIIENLSINEASLEDTFLQLTQKE